MTETHIVGLERLLIAVVAFSIVVQDMTTQALLRRLGQANDDSATDGG